MRRVAASLLIMLALILSACGETVQPEKVDSGQQSQPASGQASEQQSGEQKQQNGEQKQQTFKVGDTIKMGDLQYTVHGIREVKGNDIFKPDEGKKWVAVEVTIENKGSEPQLVSSLLGFTLQDSEGYTYNIMPVPVDLKGSLDGELAPGRKMRGEVSFEIPKDAKGLELIIDADVFGFGQAIVQLGK